MQSHKQPSKAMIVAAINFGTRYSRWAFSFQYQFERDPCDVWTNQFYSKDPTCVLIKPDETLEAFGFEARRKYLEWSAEDSHKRWYFFQRFKLMLVNKPIHIATMLDDECGKRLPALKVFSLAISYIVDEVHKILKPKCSDSDLRNIHWVLTVPALWNDAAKDFMRRAAERAGLFMTQITILLEPVAASLFCINNRKQKKVRFEFLPGHKFLVLDAGGIFDIAVYEFCFGGTLKEVYKATGGFCADEMVDKAFEDFLAEVTGMETLERYKNENMEDYIELMCDFEEKTRPLDFKSPGQFTIKLPISLKKFLEAFKRQSFKEIIKNSRYTNQVQLIGEKLRMDANIFHSLFRPSIDIIHNFLDAVLRQSATLRVDTMFMVGGLSQCHILQEAIKEKFPRMKVIVPSDASLAVLIGAVIFGHRPIEVSVIVQHGDEQTSGPQRPSWSAMPSNWEPMKPDEIFRQVCLPNTGDEFKSVFSNFIQTLDNREILTIHRIQSTFLWEHYCVKKKEMEKINGIDGAEEKILFHGTKPDIIESICAENIDMRLAGTNVGAILGHGTYFATAAKMSDGYATPDSKSGHRYMFQCRVLVGKWTMGEAGLRRPPEIAESVSDSYRKRYNSCVDNVLKPCIFCIYDNNQYYPEYVIEYE